MLGSVATVHTSGLPLLPANPVQRHLMSHINFLQKLTIQDSLGKCLWSFCCTQAADLSVFVMSPQERTYIPEDQRHTNKNSQAFCYSETIPAPTGKDDAQQKSVSSLPLFEEPSCAALHNRGFPPLNTSLLPQVSFLLCLFTI